MVYRRIRIFKYGGYVDQFIDYNGNYNHDFSFKTKKLMIPVLMNISMGKEVRLYFGQGFYGSVNFYQKKQEDKEPTLMQLGSYTNIGFQFYIKKSVSLNIEGKLICDLSTTYKTPDYSSHFGTYLGIVSVPLAYEFINIGVTYCLKDKKQK